METITTTRQANVFVSHQGIMDPVFWWSCGDCGVQSTAIQNEDQVERWADNHRCAS